MKAKSKDGDMRRRTTHPHEYVWAHGQAYSSSRAYHIFGELAIGTIISISGILKRRHLLLKNSALVGR
jgi:hypothetical protein